MPRQITTRTSPAQIERACEQCGATIYVWPYQIRNGQGRFCSKRCADASRIVGRAINTEGYVVLHVPGRGQVFEHRYVMEQYIGRPLEPGEEVHHRNENKSDNRIENLELTRRAPHMQIHHRAKLQNGWARDYPFCVECGKTDHPHNAGGKCRKCYMKAFRKHRATS